MKYNMMKELKLDVAKTNAIQILKQGGFEEKSVESL